MVLLGKWVIQKLAVHISVQVDLICLHILRKRKKHPKH